jgi:hypothetical protein
MADLRRSALGTARPKAASQEALLNVGKAASNSSDRVPGIGHDQTFVVAAGQLSFSVASEPINPFAHMLKARAAT